MSINFTLISWPIYCDIWKQFCNSLNLYIYIKFIAVEYGDRSFVDIRRTWTTARICKTGEWGKLLLSSCQNVFFEGGEIASRFIFLKMHSAMYCSPFFFVWRDLNLPSVLLLHRNILAFYLFFILYKFYMHRVNLQTVIGRR